ncbi:MAG: aldo/keto reductase [Planctomycetes bacterium]|nr:aldo/keto reductase [Planctomycetota bacterium]
MQYRPLGQTGLQVSALSLGAASLGNVYGDIDERQAIATVHRAFDLGINTFDASPYYGGTLAETVLGKALRPLPRDRYVLMTKCGRYGPTEFDFTPARLRRSIDDSLRRLGTDHVDVLQLHDIEFGDLTQIFAEAVPTLHELVTAGKTRFVGITGLPLAIFRRALAAGCKLDTILSYCHATLFDRTLFSLLPDFLGAGIGVCNASPAAMGLLSSHGPRDWHPADQTIRAVCKQAADHVRARGYELALLAMQFSCSVPGIATTICGTASPAEIAANVAAIVEPIDKVLLAEVLHILDPIDKRTWPQGRPENSA